MIGILLILMHEMSSCTPPLSPPDMPSTSSMISTIFFFGPPKKDIARFVTISRIAFEALPPTPSRMSLLLFPRVSDAFTSVTSNPSCLAIIVAALLFPMPGGPLMSTAFMGLSLPLASARMRAGHVDVLPRRQKPAKVRDLFAVADELRGCGGLVLVHPQRRGVLRLGGSRGTARSGARRRGS